MNVTVHVPTAFRRHTGGVEKLECSAMNLTDVVETLETRFPDLKPHLRDQEGKIRRYLNVYVNDEDIRFLGINHLFSEGDEITLVPSIAGGK